LAHVSMSNMSLNKLDLAVYCNINSCCYAITAHFKTQKKPLIVIKVTIIIKAALFHTDHIKLQA